RLKEFDRQIGALFGLAKGGLYCILVTMFGVTLLGDNIRETIVVSRSGHYIASVLDRSEAIIPEEIHGVVGPYLERFDAKFTGGENDPQEDGASQEDAPPQAQVVGDGALPDSFWDSDGSSAAPPLPVGSQDWLPPQGSQSQPPASNPQPEFQRA